MNTFYKTSSLEKHYKLPGRDHWGAAQSVLLAGGGVEDGQAGVDSGTVDVSPVKVNEKEPLSITDNGSGKSGRLDLN